MFRWRSGALFAAAGLVPAALGGAVAGYLPPALVIGAFAVIVGVGSAARRTPWALRVLSAPSPMG